MNARRGFSFTEILFAIMILGIGFIMVAAMFPVAFQQTEISRAETVGAAIARGGEAIAETIRDTRFYQIEPKANPLTPSLCVLRPTITFPGKGIWTDLDLYAATLPGSSVDLTVSLPAFPNAGTYTIPGEVWDFMPVAANEYGSEPVAAIATPSGPLPYSGNLSSLLCSMVSQNMVQTGDPKFAWIAFYKRDLLEMTSGIGAGAGFRLLSFAPSAQVIILAVKNRNAQQYVTTPPTSATAPPMDIPVVPTSPTPPVPVTQPPSLQASRSPLTAPATIFPPDSSHLDAGISFADPVQQQRAAEGAFVIVASDHPALVGLSNPNRGLLNGHVYRLGVFDGTRWAFAPGFAPSASDINAMQLTGSNKFLVYVVGRGLNPDGTTPTYTGLAQDVAVYSTFVACPAN